MNVLNVKDQPHRPTKSPQQGKSVKQGVDTLSVVEMLHLNVAVADRKVQYKSSQKKLVADDDSYEIAISAFTLQFNDGNYPSQAMATQ